MSCTCGCGGHDERHAPSPPHNPPGRAALDYRVGEHGTFLAAMLDRLASPANPALRGLTVRTTDDPTIGLLDAAAVLGDLLTFHSERIADEGYRGTADDERSLALLGRLVGHVPRPGVAADTYLAYTVERDPRGEDTPVLIPRGARSNSVPSATEHDAQTFETSEDLTAHWAWNRLRVRRRRPALLTPEDLKQRSELFVAGTTTSLRTGQKLLFDFGRTRLLLPVGDVRVDREEDVTAITLPQSPKPTLAELRAEILQWITPATGEPSPEHPNPRPVSKLIEDFDLQVLAPLRAELPGITSPAQFAQRLAGPLERLAEAEVLADPHPQVAEWFGRLHAVLTELRDRAADLAPVAVLQARSSRRPPASPQAPPELLGELLAMQVTATPFGATAPLQPVQDDNGRVVRQSDWPLPGGTLTSVRIAMDAAGRELVRAEFQRTESGGGWQHVEQLPAEEVSFDLGPGRVELSSRRETTLGRLGVRNGQPRPGVEVRLLPGLPACRLFISRPDDQRSVHVSIHNGAPLELDLAPREEAVSPFGPYQVTVRYTAGSEPAGVEIALSTSPDTDGRNVLPLDGVHEEITAGSRIVIERPAKGKPGGVPGDPALAFVVTHVIAVRSTSYAQYGITGRGTVLTLADPWLDEHDTQLSHIRDTTVHAAGEPLRPADEPIDEDVHGNTIELADRHDALRPGRRLIVSGPRADLPGHATEAVVIAEVEEVLDPRLPGDHPHTELTLTADLHHRYRRDSVVVHGNVVPATHGESRDEPIGSGDAAKTHQTFALWQSPLTWLPANNPLGATPTLEVRVDGLLWHEVDSLAGRGPDERVYVTGSAADGRTTVTFGDGVHGTRLPTGHENVRARYRFGTGKAANVGADRITQAVTRPLGVTGVTNPLPATGGADGDGPAQTRRTVPLAVSALDRLVSVRDYEDFSRSRSGVGRASARLVFDGRREILHVTVAGVDDIPIGTGSDLLSTLRASLLAYGDPRLPVRVEPRELVRLVVAAKVALLPDHSWEWVHPRLRRALLTELGYPGRELGRPAHLSEVLATAQSVPGVSYVDVDVFGAGPGGVAATVPARLAEHTEERYRLSEPETLTGIAARHGITTADLLRLNPDITDTRPLPSGRTVFVHRGVRPAQLVLLQADTLTLTEVR
ncbi:putative baseplate assembly protein [Saccharopolyspora antimicrobica]|uniref:Phage baseplate assembly protein n=1 Tax=Saccharopolyspora antimicrobica TaxID=455193 RepID=A0A1I5M2G1_9PSEU|nr:putative baseplate assembly protein [Saccharopolyspora antimicrobica]RKT89249.1 putative phage baseplate assembly protein [Saccharopolyspora antimicrobica]SFP03537.1 putative baseplate assembly protein [Saccharopolyspora antimicrobica]